MWKNKQQMSEMKTKKKQQKKSERKRKDTL